MKPSSIARVIGTAAVAALLCACPETTVTRDFGTRPAKLNAAEWAGTWRAAGDKNSFEISVKDASKGQLSAIFREKDEKTGADRVSTFEIIVRESGRGDDKLFFFSHFDNSETPRGPVKLMSHPSENIFILWSPDHDAVRAALRKGELKGELIVDKDDKEKNREHSALGSDPQNYEKLREQRFWNWTEPETFERVR